MNFLMLIRKLKILLFRLIGIRPLISVLIPFSSQDPVRKRNFAWLLKYWLHELPNAEFIIGRTTSLPFSKNEALNIASEKASGKVFLILDADAFMSGGPLLEAAKDIVENLRYGNRIWYVPYSHLYRLNMEATTYLTSTSPYSPPRGYYIGPKPEQIDGSIERAKYGNRFGALLYMIPKEAYHSIGNFDERFRGWGGEDISLLLALDTFWGKHRITSSNVSHLWHPTIGGPEYNQRMWEGQEKGNVNSSLALQYRGADKDLYKMAKVLEASREHYLTNKKNKK